MAIRQILLLGNPLLYGASEPVLEGELDAVGGIVTDLQDTLVDFHQRRGFGRAIAAPQIGVMKRLLYMCADDVSTVFINPRLEDRSEEMMEVWDDCLSFPSLLVKVMRHQSCRIRYRNQEWKEETVMLHGGMSELLQHECDHLHGILAVSRAIDGMSFALKSQKGLLMTG